MPLTSPSVCQLDPDVFTRLENVTRRLRQAQAELNAAKEAAWLIAVDLQVALDADAT